jgi:hypothetical protein
MTNQRNLTTLTASTAWNKDLVNLQSALYNNAEPEKALFTGPLAFQKSQVHPDGDALFRTVVEQLRATNAKVLHWLADHNSHGNNNNNNNDPLLAAGETFPIPINAYSVHGPYGMMSYPNYGSPSRSLQYPDLHLLYRACDAANVACGHVYLHRDAYDIIGTDNIEKRIVVAPSTDFPPQSVLTPHSFCLHTHTHRVDGIQAPLCSRGRPDHPVHDHVGRVARAAVGFEQTIDCLFGF